MSVPSGLDPDPQLVRLDFLRNYSMNIKLHEIAVHDLVAGYEDRGDEGVVGYGGTLDIRPAFQREFSG